MSGATGRFRTSQKYVTGVLFLTFVSTGLNFNIVSPSLLQLMSLMNLTLTEGSAVFTSRSSGYLISAPLTACIITPGNRNAVLLTNAVLMAVTVLLLPASSQLPFSKIVFYLSAGVNGVASGVMESLVNVWMLQVWGKESTPYMQALHFAFAVGCAIAPVLVSPFLSDPILVHYAYAIVSAAVFTSAILMATIFVRNGKQQQESGEVELRSDEKEQAVRLEPTSEERVSGSAVMLMSSLFLVTYSGTAIIYNQFLPTSLQTAFSLTPLTASYIHSTLNYVSSGARLVSIFVAIRCPPQFLLFFNLMMFDAGSIILLTCTHIHPSIVWTGNLIIGLGMGGCTGPLFSFLNRNSQVTNITGSLFVFCNGLTSVFVPLLVGSIMSTYPAFLVTFNVVCITTALLIFTMIYITVSRNKSVADQKQ